MGKVKLYKSNIPKLQAFFLALIMPFNIFLLTRFPLVRKKKEQWVREHERVLYAVESNEIKSHTKSHKILKIRMVIDPFGNILGFQGTVSSKHKLSHWDWVLFAKFLGKKQHQATY